MNKNKSCSSKDNIKCPTFEDMAKNCPWRIIDVESHNIYYVCKANEKDYCEPENCAFWYFGQGQQ